MKIEIHYQTLTNPKSQIVELKPEEYFDPIEENETFEADGIPKFNFTEEYLDISVQDLQWTDILIQGTDHDHNLRTTYYKGGHSMWHSKNTDGTEEMCIATQISESELNIVRMSKTLNSSWKIVFNILSKVLADSSEEETKFV